MWGLAGMIAAPLLAGGLAWTMVSDHFTIRDLRGDVADLKIERDGLKKEIDDPLTGWVVRFQASERNNVTLRGAISEQNTKLDELTAAQAERERVLDAKLAAANAQVDRFDAQIVDILNRMPSGDALSIARQAEDIVFESLGALQ